MLQRPHRVATVGVALGMRAGVATAELRSRVRDEVAEPPVVGTAHGDRELRLEVVLERDVDEQVGRVLAARRREIVARSRSRRSPLRVV